MKAKPSRPLAAVLKASRTFNGLSESCIRKILDRATYRDYPAQQWIYRQGEPARHFFLLESGLIALSEITTSGDETLLRFIYPGETTGCVAIAEMDHQVASAQALRACRVWIWKREAALKLLREVPAAAVNLISAMIRDYYHYYQQVRRLRTDPLERRIEWSLLELARALGKSTSEGTVIETSGYRQLAELAGTNIYSVSRELSRLERQGVLGKSRGRIVLFAPEQLLKSA